MFYHPSTTDSIIRTGDLVEIVINSEPDAHALMALFADVSTVPTRASSASTLLVLFSQPLNRVTASTADSSATFLDIVRIRVSLESINRTQRVESAKIVAYSPSKSMLHVQNFQ